MKSKRFNFIIAAILIAGPLIFSGCQVTNIFTGNSTENDYVYSGTAEADQINIVSELPGKIKDIKIQEGQKLKAGDLVALIDSSENTLKAQQSETTLKSAQNDLEKLNEGNRAEDIKAQQAIVVQAAAAVKQGEALIEQAENNVNSAQTNYDYKLKLYQDAKSLFDKGADTQYNVDNAKNVADNAKVQLDNAQAALESTKAQVDGYRAQQESAQQKLNLLVNGATERNKNTAQYGVDIANKNYDLSKLALDKSNIISSQSGVVETVNYKIGEYVNPGTPVATMLDLNNKYVEIYVPEKILPTIKLDKEVTMTSEFFKGKTVKGKVTYISPEAEFTPMNIISKKDREKLVFMVKVKIEDNLEAIKPGMLLDVNIK